MPGFGAGAAFWLEPFRARCSFCERAPGGFAVCWAVRSANVRFANESPAGGDRSACVRFANESLGGSAALGTALLTLARGPSALLGLLSGRLAVFFL